MQKNQTTEDSFPTRAESRDTTLDTPAKARQDATLLLAVANDRLARWAAR